MAKTLDLREAQRDQARNALQQSEERFRALVQNSTDAIGITDEKGNILYQTSNLQTSLGYDASGVVGGSIADYLWPEDQLRAQIRLAELVRAPGATQWDEIRLRQRDGSSRFIESTSSNFLQNPAIRGIVFNYRDITRRRQAELELKESNRKLRVLSQRLVKAQETERRNISRELHDEIGQSLTVAQMNLQAMQQTAHTPPQASQLKETLAVIERVLEQVHDISLNLHPAMLDDLGLESALRWYTRRQSVLAGFKSEVRAEHFERRLTSSIETECFRVAQGALTNVMRHAKAKSVVVELTRKNEQLHLSVRDDGIGFDVAAVHERAVGGASLGVLSMAERAELAGGGLEYLSSPGKGAEVHAWFPLVWRTSEDSTSQ